MAIIHLLAGEELAGAEGVLVGVVGVNPENIQGGVGVSAPAAAAVHRVVDAAEAVLAGQAERHAVVLAVGDVLEAADGAQGGCVEGAGSTEAVDAQGVVVAVGVGPLAVVDDSGRYGPQVEVGHHIAADDHGAPLAAEHVHYPLQGIRPAVHVVAVELHARHSVRKPDG